MQYLFLCAATAAFALSPSAQVVEPGYDSTLTSLPSTVAAVYDLPGPGVVYYDGRALVLDDGTSTRSILTFATPPAFASFTIPIGQSAVLFGESSNGEIWYVPLAEGSSPRRVATVPFNYDAVAWDQDTVLVSAKTGGFMAPDNDVVALDLSTGGTDRILRMPGFSGPIAFDRHGGLYYATATLGTSDLLRFGAAQLASAVGPGELTVLDATMVFAALPSAGDLAVDDDGDVLVTDFTAPSLLEVSVDPIAGTHLSMLISYPPGSPSAAAVSYTPAPDPAAFEPFQPAFGKSLTVVESQFGGAARIRTLHPSRPVTTVPSAPIGGGSFAIQTSGAPAGALGAMLVSTGFANTLPFSFAGIEQPVLFELALGSVIASAELTFDGAGNATLPLFNGGFTPPADFAIQVVFVGTGARGETIVGSAAAELLRLSI